MDTMIIFAAQYLIYLIGIMVLLYAIYRLPRGELKSVVLLYVIGILVAFILVKIAGSNYYNPRPFVDGNFTPLIPHGSTNGFPSNHTVAAVLIASLLWRYSRRLAGILFIAACLVGVARVLAYVHHIEDIIGGIVIAIFATLIANLIVHLIINRKVSKLDN
jgi:membrane-associated phospholipid phosphatase